MNGELGEKVLKKYNIENEDTNFKLCFKYLVMLLMHERTSKKLNNKEDMLELQRKLFSDDEIKSKEFELIDNNEFYCDWFNERCKYLLSIDKDIVTYLLEHMNELVNL